MALSVPSKLTVPQNVGPVARSIVDHLTVEGIVRKIPVTVGIRYDLVKRTLVVRVDRHPAVEGDVYEAEFPLAAFVHGITLDLAAKLDEVFK